MKGNKKSLWFSHEVLLLALLQKDYLELDLLDASSNSSTLAFSFGRQAERCESLTDLRWRRKTKRR